jgi:hypothetical protein
MEFPCFHFLPSHRKSKEWGGGGGGRILYNEEMREVENAGKEAEKRRIV